MAGNGRKSADGVLITALAAGKCVRVAAEEAGIGERTVYRRLEDAAFRRQVDEARGDMISRATGQLSDAATSAVETLRALLTSTSDTVRLGAARSILELGGRLRESEELEKRIERLEEAARP